MKFLKNINTGAFIRYPRLDDDAVVGLDDVYIVYDFVSDPVPVYDSSIERTEVQLIDDIDNRVYRRTYIVVSLTSDEIVQRSDSVLQWELFMRAFYRGSAYARLLVFGVAEPIIILALQEIGIVLLGFKTEPMLRIVFLRLKNRMTAQSLTFSAVQLNNLNAALNILGVSWRWQTLA